ncbi:anion permease [Pseudactinotalea sp. Z1748]|uniref:inorganic phosphate transporter n=1 Tax=Pseudactinotalea sp. Z1748 TaxID=3413027 RepID=UPI003C7B1B18
MIAPELLIGLGLAFALITGTNDGGALLAPGLRVPGLRLLPALAILTLATAVIPLVTAAPVAHTLTSTIVPPGQSGSLALLVAFVSAVVVVWALTRRGLPTSLTLAVIGATAGAGAGLGLAVAWSALTVVLIVAALAPFVGLGLALAGSTLLNTRWDSAYLPVMRRGHLVAFTAQCIAYGANDGQKILVLLLAAGLAHPDGRLSWWWYLALGLAFAIGTALGLPRIARSVGTGILHTSPAHIVTAEFAAAGAVLGSAALGAPVSMTQAIIGGLLGAGLRESYRRIRWKVVRGLGLAWLVTLPLAFTVAALGAYVTAAVMG